MVVEARKGIHLSHQAKGVTHMRKPNLSKKVLLSLGAIAAAASIAGMGTFAAYSSTTSASSDITTGTVVINLGTAGTSANHLAIAATNVLPGDTISRSVDLISTSSDSLASVKLTTTASTSSALDTSVAGGLQLVVQKCATAWTETANTGTSGYSYSCGTPISVLATGAVIQAASTLNNLAVATPAGYANPTTDHLLVTMTLPSGTTETQVPQGAHSIILFTFDAAQHAATVR
jgi:predicted ribosomally synthesized peptide with SipW-like signal peptide